MKMKLHIEWRTETSAAESCGAPVEVHPGFSKGESLRIEPRFCARTFGGNIPPTQSAAGVRRSPLHSF